jgi:hypothetical protein
VKVIFASHGSGVGAGAERTVIDLAAALRRDGRVEPIVTVPRAGVQPAELERAEVAWRAKPAAQSLVAPDGLAVRRVGRAVRQLTAVARHLPVVRAPARRAPDAW